TKLFELGLCRLKRCALINPEKTHQLTRILLREKALGHDRVQVYVQAYRGQKNQQHEATVAQRPVQRRAISPPEEVTYPLKKQTHSRWLSLDLHLRFQQTRTHHGCQDQRQQQRHHDGCCKRYG